MSKSNVRYLIFDAESVAEGELVAKLKYPEENLSPDEAVDRYRAELLERFDSEFIPYTYHIPVSVVVAKVSPAFELLELVALDEPQFRPQVITEHFWRGWSGYGRPTLVTFNGRAFDIPLLELAAFRYGIPIPDWLGFGEKFYDQRRNRYNQAAHFDLQEFLTNFGASRFAGGLDLAAQLLGKPGKMAVVGQMVQDMHRAGKTVEINDYCRCDVLDTYFVFLRAAVMLGHLKPEQEQQLVAQTRTWLEQQAEHRKIYETYLSQCP
ncbi:MAG TPA: 3'-5' exonuclease [Pirellulaceae bacterium]|nr:3'-5' exonuclease [Pirellulaceae bacterium]